MLEEAGYEALAVEDGDKGIKEIKSNPYNLVICDIKLPGADGIQVLKEIKKIKPDLPVLMLTAFGDIKNAVDAIKQGAQDYLTKPFNNEEMIFTIRKTLEMDYLNKEVNLLRKKTDEAYKSDKMIVGNSKKIKEVFEQVKIVTPTALTVLIQGESGTGKEVIANFIHRLSDRNKKPFIAVDCGAIPESLIESELFGHEKGAFTDAKTQKIGKFEQANEGTLFLDEITNLSESNQIKLLRAIQERKISRLGGKNPVKLDVRIIAASNTRLSDIVKKERFRDDLYYRLNEFHIDLPPLRERKDDIKLFAEHFVKEANEELNKNVVNISKKMAEKLINYSWPGNIRELRNVIRRAVLLSTGDTLDSINLPEETPSFISGDGDAGDMTFEYSTKQAERDIILKALEQAGGNKSKAARILNMNQRTFYRKIKNLGI
ncbi:MAG: sigma-54 dependent transcriptional regulator [Chlorobi bacterium]|nr:sigma-54 dependent transcriptional regulator [Chlorobiota bacterium]MCI0715510.1 sigma-54 dependent transcriptional regulator [Chlorobiota bacterium]